MTGLVGRIVAIALALSVVVSAWLLFEYSEASRQRQAAELSLGGRNAAVPRAVDSSPSSARTLRDSTPDSSVTIGRPSGSLIYKCRGRSGTAYRDHPCTSEERELQVTVAGPASAPRYNLEQLKAKADEMETASLSAMHCRLLRSPRSKGLRGTQGRPSVMPWISRSPRWIRSSANRIQPTWVTIGRANARS